MANLTKQRCRNCGLTSDFLPMSGGDDVLICSQCHGWSWQSTLPIRPEEIYSEDYFTGAEYASYEASSSVFRKNFERKFRLLKCLGGFHSPTTRVLEVGCSTGEFLTVLRVHQMTDVLGLEVSQFASERARAKNLPVISPLSAQAHEVIREFQAETICAWDVWEHLEDPVAIFDNLIASSPGLTTVALTTVDSGQMVPRLRKRAWRQFHPPSHLHYPTRRSFEIYFRSRGFEIIEQSSFGMYRPLADYLFALFKPLRKFVSGNSWLYRIPLYLNLFDIQMVIARKKAKS